MKKNKNGNDGRVSRRIDLEFTHPTASRIFVAGTFNGWRLSDTPMLALGNGRWAADLTLPAGSYEYRLVADGQWMADPAARKTVPNPFGGVNSVLEVSPEAAGEKGAAAPN
jgi:1,4-alpha-glucan branching enzyme